MPDVPYTMGGSSPGAEVSATPPKYPLALNASETVGAIHDFMGKPFGYDNPPGRLLGNFLGLSDLKGVLERIGYGERLTEGSGMSLRIPDETIGAIGALPFGTAGKAGRLGKLAFGERTAAEMLSPEIKMMHSSPHKFDEFDSSHIGKGEGAQVYGQGIYTTDDPGVHKYYNKKFKDYHDRAVEDKWTGVIHDGKHWSMDEYEQSSGALTPEFVAKENIYGGKGVDEAIDRMNVYIQDNKDNMASVKQLLALSLEHPGEPTQWTPLQLKETLNTLEHWEKLYKDSIDWIKANKDHIKYADPLGVVKHDGKVWKLPDWEGGYTPAWYGRGNAGPGGTLADSVLDGIHAQRAVADPKKAWRAYIEVDMSEIQHSLSGLEAIVRPTAGVKRRIEEYRGALDHRRKQLDWFEQNKDLIEIDKSSNPPMPRAQRYEAEFPDKHANKLLHYDEPYSEQTPYVQKRLQKMLGKDHETLLKSNQSGRDLYERAGMTATTSERITDETKAAYMMRDAGIPGHKYYAAGSRGKGIEKRNHNYVIYPGNEKKYLKITKREDIPD